MAIKKIPVRMCTGCKERKPKKELIRVVRTPEGEILLDASGKQNGRGAYICRDEECLKKAAKANSLARALETQITPEIYDRLGEEIRKLE